MKTSPTTQFMFLVRGSCHDASQSAEQMQAHMTEVYAWIDGLTKQGVMTAAQPLTPESKLVSGEGGISVTDGVYAESKESIAGFFIVNAATMEEAVAIARTSPNVLQGGRLEVRRIADLTCEPA